MGDMDNLLAIIGKLEKVETLSKKVEELTIKLDKLEKELSEYKKEQLTNVIIKQTKDSPVDVADLAIYEYAKNPPRIRG
jgi:hypothetical protein